MAGQIITRADAEKEIQSTIRYDKRRKKLGYCGIDGRAAKLRRDISAQMLTTAKGWRDRGEMGNAIMVAKLARAQLIIARGIERYLHGID